MAIHLDNIPKDKPADMNGFPLPAPGFHIGTIVKATMKPSKTPGAEDYIAIEIKLADGSIVYDNIYNTEKAAVQYKLGRLITACKLPLVGSIEMPDLARVIVNKQIVADICVKPNTYNGVTKDKAEVDMFSNMIFYPVEMYSELTGGPATPAPSITTPSTESY